MALASNAGSMTVDPNGNTATVQFFNSGTSNTAAVYNDAALTQASTQPENITLAKQYFFKNAVTIDMSVKVNGVECATPTGNKFKFIAVPGMGQGFQVPFNSTIASQITAAGGATVVASGVSSVNGAQGAVTITKAMVTATGLAANDVSAVSKFGGGAEGRINANVSGTYNVDLSTANIIVATLTGNTTFNLPAISIADGAGFLLYTIQGNNTISWSVASSGTIVWMTQGGLTPTPATGTGASDIFSFLYVGTTNQWLGFHNTAKLAISNTSLSFTAASEPANPPSGTVVEWFDSTTQKFLWKDSAGNKHDFGTVSAPAGGQITQVAGQSSTSTNLSAAGTFSISLPNTPANGNHVIAVFACSAFGGGLPSPSSGTNTVVSDAAHNSSDNIGSIGIYRIKSTGVANDKTITWTFSGTQFCYAFIGEYTGVHATTPVDTAANPAAVENHNTSSSSTITSGTLAQTSEFIVVGTLTGGDYQGGGNASWGTSGFGTLYDSGAGVAGSKTVSATTAVTATPTYPSNQYQNTVMVCYRAA